MIFIDLENKLPTDFDLSDAVRWKPADWEAWLAESARLVGELATLHAAGNSKGRNDLIGKNSDHWGKLKPWLLALSGGKCWFTEARDIASHLDVEHFRPKKASRFIKGPERGGRLRRDTVSLWISGASADCYGVVPLAGRCAGRA